MYMCVYIYAPTYKHNEYTHIADGIPFHIIVFMCYHVRCRVYNGNESHVEHVKHGVIIT